MNICEICGTTYYGNDDAGVCCGCRKGATTQRTKAQQSEQLKNNRKVAKFFGGKALTGTARQKEWAEAIRAEVLGSPSLTNEQKTKLVQVGGFTQSSKFWIENRNVSHSEFIAENIVSEYNKMVAIEAEKYDVLARSGPVSDKESAKSQVRNFLDSLCFKMPTSCFNRNFYYNA